MVQFNLPKNSKILKGQYFKDETGSSNVKVVRLSQKVIGKWGDYSY